MDLLLLLSLLLLLLSSSWSWSSLLFIQMETISQQLYTINCFNQSKYIEKFYDPYHKLYLDIWDNYDNLALTMEYYDEFIKSRQESLLRFKEFGTDPLLKNKYWKKKQDFIRMVLFKQEGKCYYKEVLVQLKYDVIASFLLYFTFKPYTIEIYSI